MAGDRSRLVRCALLLITVMAVVAAPATAVSDISQDSPSATLSVGEPNRIYQAGNENNNTTVPHEDPEEVKQENRLDRLASYLAGDLNGRIEQSSVQLSQGEYDAARSALGDGYSDAFGKYVDVQGETEGEGANDEYETVQATQREYVDTVSEFQETRREYEAARQASQEDRARELARELAQLAEEGESQSAQLTNRYAQIANRTGDDLSGAVNSVETVQSNISEQRDEIIAREFVETRLLVQPSDRNISFSDPVEVTGTLTTANGTSVNVSQARFAVGKQVIRTAVAPDGRFTFTYRPAAINSNTTVLAIEYRPPPQSVYRASSESVPVNVTQVTAIARALASGNSTYGYADPVDVGALLEVNGTPVVNYPLVVSVAGVSLSTAQTNSSGRSTLDGSVPASVPVGQTNLRIAGDSVNRAVRVQPATVSVSIVSTTTELNADARSDADGITVDGRLLTSDGDPIDGQSVALTLEGRTLDATTTGGSGQYRMTVDLPSNVNVGNATVLVRFDGAGTNLESAQSRTDITVTEGVSGSAGLQTLSSRLFQLGGSNVVWIGLIVALVASGGIILTRRRGEGTNTDSTETTSETTVDVAEPDPSEPSRTDTETPILQSATETLSDGYPNDAVVTAYASVREVLGGRITAETGATHWEFYRHCLKHGIGQEELLESLTESYEKAAYSGLTLSAEDAETVLETARQLLDTADR